MFITLKLTPEEAQAVEDALAYYHSAASPNGAFGGPADSASEDEAETYALVSSALDLVQSSLERHWKRNS